MGRCLWRNVGNVGQLTPRAGAFPANFLKRPSRKCLDFVDSGGSFPPDIVMGAATF